MKRSTLHRAILTGGLPIALAACSWGKDYVSLPSSGACRPEQSSVISAEDRCMDSGGIDIGYFSGDGLKVACMKNKQVQGTCGPDGSLTRLHAYAAWMTKLKQFQDSCSDKGGSFAYENSAFQEPQDESYCLQAEPEVGANMFEDSLCNYHSVCPPVTVVCNFPCGGSDPAAASYSPGEVDAATLAALRVH